jgi:SAM-dependent methyltransferase
MTRLRPSTIPAWPVPFDAGAELDWGEPVFGRRLLREHLDQSHDGGSRRLTTVDRHIARLCRLLPPPPARILDAACGPGLYSVRLAACGYQVTGVDANRAAINHARGLAREMGVAPRFSAGDLADLSLDQPVDAAILIYFVLEAVPRRRQVSILRRLAAAIRPGGRFIAELRVRPEHPPGRLSTWDLVPWSLLGEQRHLLLTDSVYDDRRHTYVLREVAVFDDGRVAVQQTTSAMLPLREVAPTFARAGLRVRAVYDGFSRYRATGLSQTLLVVAERPA